MSHKVVTTVARTCRDLGVIAVRFNYRGVGLSVRSVLIKGLVKAMIY